MAHESIKHKFGYRQRLILRAISELCSVMGDATDSEIMSHLTKVDPNYVRPRRFELVNQLKVVGFSQKRRCKVTGETCMAWKILKGGVNEIRKMQSMQKDEVPNQTFENREPSAPLHIFM